MSELGSSSASDCTGSAPIGALGGVRVLDCTSGPTGGLATMVLADFGADVVKVEGVGDTPARKFVGERSPTSSASASDSCRSSFAVELANSATSDPFRALASSSLWLRGKRSVRLDADAAGFEQLHQLVVGADVVVVSGSPSQVASRGLDADSVAKLRPGIVHCSVSGWGQRGPLAEYPVTPAIVAAKAGRMAAFAEQIRRPGPAYAALPVQVHAAAHGAVQGIVSALIARHRQPQPLHRVETSLLQGLLPYDLVELLLTEMVDRHGVAPSPNPGAGSAMPTLNYHPVLASDGVWLQNGNLLEHLFLSFLDAIGLYGELLEDERFHNSPARWTTDAVDEVRNRMLAIVRTQPSKHWMRVFHENGNVAAEPFLTPADALSHPDLVANGSIVEFDDPARGRVRTIGAIARLSATPAVIGGVQPTLPAVEAVGWADDRDHRGGLSVERQPPTEVGRPLAGITVVEFAAVIAAPLGTSMLADLGARVIRVEPTEGDSFRHLMPHGVMAVKTTAGKESICLDLKSARGRAIAAQLIEKADVLVHNYRPGVPERLGIGWEELSARHPGLVWVAVNGYGPDGPSAHRPATHPVAGSAMGGAGYQAGAALTALDANTATIEEIREHARQLMRANESNPDPNTSVIVASSVAIALHARLRTGLGQAIHIDMLTANAHANADAFLAFDGQPSRPTIDADLFGTGALHRLYPCRTGWVFLDVTTDLEWQACAPGIGAEELYWTYPITQHHLVDGPLAAAIADRLLSDDADAWERRLVALGVGCVRADAATPGLFFAHDPHVQQNGFAPVVDHARFGSVRRWGPLVHIDGGASSYGPGCLGGEHADALLAELGYDVAAIADLRASGVVTSEPVASFP